MDDYINSDEVLINQRNGCNKANGKSWSYAEGRYLSILWQTSIILSCDQEL